MYTEKQYNLADNLTAEAQILVDLIKNVNCDIGKRTRFGKFRDEKIAGVIDLMQKPRESWKNWSYIELMKSYVEILECFYESRDQCLR